MGVTGQDSGTIIHGIIGKVHTFGVLGYIEDCTACPTLEGQRLQHSFLTFDIQSHLHLVLRACKRPWFENNGIFEGKLLSWLNCVGHTLVRRINVKVLPIDLNANGSIVEQDFIVQLVTFEFPLARDSWSRVNIFQPTLLVNIIR